MGRNVAERPAGRFWEIDFLRGAAVVSMILIHLLDDLYFLGFIRSFPWRAGIIWQRITAALFLTLVGVSLALGSARAGPEERGRLFWKNCRRGGKIFLWGMGISLVTRILLREGFIDFGVLHFIGVAVAASFPFLRLGYWNLFWGALSLGIGHYLSKLQMAGPWLLWLGVKPENYFAADYFPLFPWFGLILWGLFLGNTLYAGYRRRFRLQDRRHLPVIRWGCRLGEHSLLIYLIHQPLLIGLLYLYGWLSGRG
jgi:uncharacterized membrane protein